MLLGGAILEFPLLSAGTFSAPLPPVQSGIHVEVAMSRPSLSVPMGRPSLEIDLSRPEKLVTMSRG
jgi:hypothetical protein